MSFADDRAHEMILEADEISYLPSVAEPILHSLCEPVRSAASADDVVGLAMRAIDESPLNVEAVWATVAAHAQVWDDRTAVATRAAGPRSWLQILMNPACPGRIKQVAVSDVIPWLVERCVVDDDVAVQDRNQITRVMLQMRCMRPGNWGWDRFADCMERSASGSSEARANYVALAAFLCMGSNASKETRVALARNASGPQWEQLTRVILSQDRFPHVEVVGELLANRDFATVKDATEMTPRRAVRTLATRKGFEIAAFRDKLLPLLAINTIVEDLSPGHLKPEVWTHLTSILKRSQSDLVQEFGAALHRTSYAESLDSMTARRILVNLQNSPLVDSGLISTDMLSWCLSTDDVGLRDFAIDRIAHWGVSDTGLVDHGTSVAEQAQAQTSAKSGRLKRRSSRGSR